MTQFLFIAMASLLTCSDSTSLAGRVLDSRGEPVKDAIVDVYSGALRDKTKVTTPRYFANTAKSARTNDKGEFLINDLDPGYQFQLQVFAAHLRYYRSDMLEPNTKDLELRLEPIPVDLPVDRYLVGRVLDQAGAPIKGAVISPFLTRNSAGGFGGEIKEIDRAATDEEGRFRVTSQISLQTLQVRVWAAGFSSHTT